MTTAATDAAANHSLLAQLAEELRQRAISDANAIAAQSSALATAASAADFGAMRAALSHIALRCDALAERLDQHDPR